MTIGQGNSGDAKLHAGLRLALLAFAFLGVSAAARAETSLWSGPPRPAISRPSGDFPGAVNSLSAEPGASAWSVTEQARVRLVTAAAAAGEAASLRLGLEMELKPGWKTYWRSPGAAGLPPAIDWAGSTNLASAEMMWPAPRRFTLLGLDTLGYEDEVLLPIDATLAAKGQPLDLRAKVDYLVCREICIPYTAALALTVPSGPAAATPFAHTIDRYVALVPGDGQAAGLKFVRVVATGTAARPLLEVVAQGREPFQKPDLFVEGPSGLAFGAPEVTLADGDHAATFRLRIETAAKRLPDFGATPLTLTLVDGARSVEARATAASAPMDGPLAGLAPMLALALLGGLILNLMPCVLPVLSLKLLGLVAHGGAERREIRLSFLASAAGVMFAFAALAAAAIALKLTGHAIGWGIQFQQPAFLTALAILCMLFAANLWSLYEIALPGFLADAALRGGGPGLVGSFLAGAFATLLATPCSAPFVGTALGFALAGGPAEIASVFLALGLGLALPYLAVAALPGLAGRLPRPGRWMVTLRAILGVALAGTAAWLVTVLDAEVGIKASLGIAVSLAVIPGALWARRHWPAYTGTSAPAALIVAVVLAFAFPSRLPPERAPADAMAPGWRNFAQAEIPGLVARGETVFVDVTADWCITCQANKRLVLDRAPVKDLLDGPGVERLRADWTRPSDEIAAYLASFGRYGIPFDIVYGPGAPAGIPLSELLTSDAVADAIAKASRHPVSSSAGASATGGQP